MVWWGVDQIEWKFKRLLDHIGNYFIQKGTDAIQTRVGVDLNQPWLEIAINHEIQPKYLKIIELVVGAHLGVDTPNGVFPYLLHLWQNFIFEIVLPISESVQVVLKLGIRQFVCRLVLAIIWKVLLNRIIGQMDLRIKVVNVEVVRRGSNVALFVPVGSGYSIEVGDKHVVSDIELPFVVKKRSVNVHLDYICLFILFDLLLFGISVGFLALFDDTVQLINLVDNCYSSALVWVFTRFDDPNISGLFQCVFFGFFFFSDDFRPPLIVFDKSFILVILKTTLNVKS